MELIPSLDLLDGRVVRLTRGDFATAKVYGDAEDVLDALQVPRGARLHVVDLEASRSGKPIETDIVRRLARRELIVQVGGGIRSLEDARRWLDCGAERIVVGTAAVTSLLDALVDAFGPQRIVPAIDVRDGVVRTDGWTRASSVSMRELFTRIEALQIAEALVTDITKDGALRGPSFALYRELRRTTRVKIIASGGVSQTSDLVSLARLGNVSGCVVGKALLERRVDLHDARARLAACDSVPARVIPCLDVRGGRVVKGVSFTNIRDAGDPVECAMRYEEEGADELVILDIEGNRSSLDTIHRVAESIFIPLTVGGGIRSVEDFRETLRAGADRVAINTAALRRPELIAECSAEFGVQAVVLSVDGKGGFCAIRGGKEVTDVDAIAWCRRGEELGAGEILLTSVDRDGTNAGFDLELLRAATGVLNIGVIASGGAGALDHFRDAVEAGGARAMLAASLFHDRVLTVGDVKRHLEAEGIPVR
jgi:phosphoribosylformimino-5-aminoimidazole carboxamide ribotide isomerase